MDTLSQIPHLLSWVIFLPLLGALVALFVPGREGVKWTALLTTLVTFVLSLGLYAGFDLSQGLGRMPQMAEVSASWFGNMDVKYFVGVDGLNLLLILLTTLLGPVIVLASWKYIDRHERGFYTLLLLLQTGMTGVFAAFDLLLFYIFFELTLIPMYFIIGIWGSGNRIYAAVKFVIFTLVGSLLMLVGIIYLGYHAGEALNNGMFTTDWYKLSAFGLSPELQVWLFLAFALAFAIKVPLFPLHTWLPDAHTEAPTAGSVILAGVLLKMGTYGLVRFCLPFFPNASFSFAPLLAVLGIIGIVYAALVSRVQEDAKKLIAYSSVAHLGFVVLGIFAFTVEALQGAMIQMVNHGLSTGALFLLIGMLYERRHTRLMKDYGGIARVVPKLTFFMILSVLASVGLPGLNGFVGEFMILLGSFRSEVVGSPVLIAIATSGVIFAAVYLLWLVYRVFFGPIRHEENRHMPDLTLRELLLLIPVALFMVWIGFGPRPFLAISEKATTDLIEQVREKRVRLLSEEVSGAPVFRLVEESLNQKNGR